MGLAGTHDLRHGCRWLPWTSGLGSDESEFSVSDSFLFRNKAGAVTELIIRHLSGHLTGH